MEDVTARKKNSVGTILAIAFALVIIVLVVIAIVRKNTGNGSGEVVEGVVLETTEQEVSSISMEIAFGEITILSGDAFQLSVENAPKDAFTSEVKGGVWEIKSEYDDASRRMLGLGEKESPKITLTLPAEFVAVELEMDIGACTLKAERLAADLMDFSVGAGQARIEELEAEGGSELTIGAGELIIERLRGRDLSVDCGVGRAAITGVINGDSKVNCGVGKVELKLEGREGDYNYTVDCGIGSVKINGKSMSFDDKTIVNAGAEKRLDLDCGVGAIELSFYEE